VLDREEQQYDSSYGRAWVHGVVTFPLQSLPRGFHWELTFKTGRDRLAWWALKIDVSSRIKTVT
jgi:hypothetical protein